MTDYDYIVVGAGSAGSVVASRLSEDPDVRVLLLEAGPTDDVETIPVPPAWPAHWGTDVDWDIQLEPQDAFDGAVHHWPRGKVLGGSSSINAMVHLRGHRSNYDGWAAAGNVGWAYHDLLPLFRRMETARRGDESLRGFDGPIRVGPHEDPHPLASAFVDAAKNVGHRVTDDFNGDDQTGVGMHDLAIHEGARQSAAVGYLHPVADRPNLEIRTDAPVLRLTFDGSRCTGVEVAGPQGPQAIRAEAEVVVSCGAIGSPHLLQRSGVGPADLLQGVGVDVVHDLPEVGENLHDHPMSGVIYEAARPIPVATSNHAEASLLGWVDPAAAEPDLQLMFITVPFHPPTVAAPENSYTIGVAVVQPTSRGHVRLRSADPDVAPIVDPHYLSDEPDVVRMVQGLRVAREIGEDVAFAGWRQAEVLPGPDLADDAALRDYLRRGTGQYYHPVGTCRMGPDADSVVDPWLRVRGIERLRVADASIMPTIVSANTNPASLVIGEKAADLIRG